MYILPKCDEINAINIKYQDDRRYSNREKNSSLSLIMAKISNINLMQIYHVFIKTTTKNDVSMFYVRIMILSVVKNLIT